MSKKPIELFMQHLEKENLKQINPKALTAREIKLFGHMRGFNFSINDLRKKINEIQITPIEELGAIEKSWKK